MPDQLRKEVQRALAKERRAKNPELAAAKSRAWREANPERHSALYKAWRQRNLEYDKARKKAWRAARVALNPPAPKPPPRTADEKAAYHKQYREAHKEQRATINAKWRAENRERQQAYFKAYGEANPEKISAKGRLRYALKRRTLEEIAGRPRPDLCETCGRPGKICFDHDHKTGAFRGWLCSNCNSVLGYCEDRPEILTALAAYLSAPTAMLHTCPSCGKCVTVEEWADFEGVCVGCAAAIGELPA